MIVAMAAMGVVEMPLDEVVGVIAMRNRGMAATGRVDVAGCVTLARVVRGTAGRVRRIDRDRAFVDVVAVYRVQVAVVDIVDVTAVLDGEMAAVGTVRVVVSSVRSVGHGKSFLGRRLAPSIQ